MPTYTAKPQDAKYQQKQSRLADVSSITLLHVQYSTRQKKLPINGPFTGARSKTGLERGENGSARSIAPVRLPVRTGACIG